MKTFTPASSSVRDSLNAVADAIKYATGDNNSCEIVENGADGWALVVKDSSGNNLAAFASGSIPDLGITQNGTYVWNGGAITSIGSNIAGSSSAVELYGTSDAFYIRQPVGSGSSHPVGIAVCGYSTNCKVFIRSNSQNGAPTYKSGGFGSVRSFSMIENMYNYDSIRQASFGTFPIFVDTDLSDLSNGGLSAVFLSSGSQGYYTIGQDNYYYLNSATSGYERFLIKDTFS